MDDVDRLVNGETLPIVSSLTCNDGFFIYPEVDNPMLLVGECLGETLLEAEGKGAIALFQSAGNNYDLPSQDLNKAFHGQILKENNRVLGPAVCDAMEHYLEINSYDRLLDVYLLLGDPALKLPDAPDADGDDARGCDDNCIGLYNPSQDNYDLDAFGDACDWDIDGDGFWNAMDCDEFNELVYPGAAEVCDGTDNDCDGAAGEDEVDEDGDGWMVCDDDCDDTEPAMNPGAEEGPVGDASCSDGLDNDCDGLTDIDDAACFPECFVGVLG